PLWLCRALRTGMISRSGGCILKISSQAVGSPQAGQAVYTEREGVMESQTLALAIEKAAHGIRVNALAPGFLDSSMLKKMTGHKQEEVLKKIPLARWGTLEEVAEAAFFLCSEQSSYMTGQVFVVDGGMGM